MRLGTIQFLHTFPQLLAGHTFTDEERGRLLALSRRALVFLEESEFSVLVSTLVGCSYTPSTSPHPHDWFQPLIPSTEWGVKFQRMVELAR